MVPHLRLSELHLQQQSPSQRLDGFLEPALSGLSASEESCAVKMKKNITICFRTSSNISNYLKSIAGKQRLSLSHVLESVIYQHQEHNADAVKPVDPDRRQYQRKQVMLPAFIGKNPSQVQKFETGSVLDISLGGIRFLVSGKRASEIQPNEEPTEYSVIFTLPNQRQPITVRCRPHSVLDAPEEVQIGAAFVDADFQDYQNLQKYLSN